MYPGPPADVAGAGADVLYPPDGGIELEVDPGFGHGVPLGIPEPVIGGAVPYDAAIAAPERERMAAAVNFMLQVVVRLDEEYGVL